jgi:hypothetical protein
MYVLNYDVTLLKNILWENNIKGLTEIGKLRDSLRKRY